MAFFKVKLAYPDVLVPKRATNGAAGYDIHSYENRIIQPWTRTIIKTGLHMEINKGYYGRIAPRSGMTVKGIDIGAGVIDCDYRGEVGVILINNSDGSFAVEKGMRIAQLIITKIETPEVEIVENIDDTARGDGGFGSTGK